MAKVITIQLPEYSVASEPNHKLLGRKVDDVLRRYFMDKTVVVRALSSAEHQGKTIDELVKSIKSEGTDRYDPNRKGDRYDNLEGKHIDLFGFRRKVTPRMRLFKDVTWGFYHGSIAIHGKPTRIDLLIVYDALQMTRVLHSYEGRDGKKRDGFVFKDPGSKPKAVLGIVVIR